MLIEMKSGPLLKLCDIHWLQNKTSNIIQSSERGEMRYQGSLQFYAGEFELLDLHALTGTVCGKNVHL